MCKRMERVFIYIGVFCFTQGVNSQWTGNIKRLLDAAPITSAEVKTITTEIFSGVNYTALYQTCETKPVARNVFSPEGCDKTEYAHMEQGLDHSDQFNGSAFLSGVWSSEFGEALIKYFQRKGVNASLLSDAFRKTWLMGGRTELSELPLERVFFGRSNSSKFFNNWYTFTMIRKRYTDPSMTYGGEDVPECIKASKSGVYSAEFLYPSHPYIDLIVYTLCYWRSDYNKQCNVQVPGHKTFAVGVQKNRGSDHNSYLYTANLDCVKSP